MQTPAMHRIASTYGLNESSSRRSIIHVNDLVHGGSFSLSVPLNKPVHCISEVIAQRAGAPASPTSIAISCDDHTLRPNATLLEAGIHHGSTVVAQRKSRARAPSSAASIAALALGIIDDSPTLPFDVLRIIVDNACSGPDVEQLELDACDPLPAAEIDDRTEQSAWSLHYRTCLSISLVCRAMHSAAMPHMWSRIAPTISLANPSDYLKKLATRSRVPAFEGEAEGLRFGEYVRILSMANVSTGKASAVQRIEFFRNLAAVVPNVQHLVAGSVCYDSRHGPLFGFWPALRSLRRIHGASLNEEAPGASELMITRLARLPSLQALSVESGIPMSPAFFSSLSLRTRLPDPITGRLGTGLTDLVVAADSLGSEEVLTSLIAACPNLRRLHVGGNCSISWPTLHVASLLASLSPHLVHLGIRPRVNALIGTFDAVLRKLPHLRSLSLRARFASFELIRNIETAFTYNENAQCSGLQHQLQHLSLRDVTTTVRDSSTDGGLVCEGRKAIKIACRRLLEANDAGCPTLDPVLLARIHAVVEIESSRC